MKRRLFNLLTLVSLALCLATTYLVRYGVWRITWGRQHQWFISQSNEFLDIATYNPFLAVQLNLSVIRAVAMIMPTVWVVRWDRERRLRNVVRLRGRCAVCGYDLRATPDRCPECGTVPRRKAV